MTARFFALALTLTPLAYSEPAPSAQEILASVRMLETRQQMDLNGQLRDNETVIPFRLIQTGPIIRYSFSNPEEELQLRLGETAHGLTLSPTPARKRLRRRSSTKKF